MTADEVASHLEARGIAVSRHGREYRVLCPTHADVSPSVDFRDGEDRVLVTCRAGCPTEPILAIWGLSMRDLFHEPPGPANVIEEYEYHDERGALLYVVERREGKRFRQRRPDGNGGWIWNLNGTRRVLYRLPQVLAAIAEGKVVCICEGEKDVHALERIGRVATCNPGGAGKWRDEYTQSLAGGRLVVIADRDKPGYAHAEAVAASVKTTARSVMTVEPVEGNDASEHLARHTFLDFVPLRLADRNGSKPHPRIIDMTEALRLAAEPLPERCGMLAIDGFVTIIAGMRSERKSWLAMSLCAAVADGAEVAGINCRRGVALYIDAENGARELARRYQALGVTAGDFYFADGMGIRLPTDISEVRDLIVATKANLCVLDSLRRLAPTAREDRSDDMAPVFAEIARVSRETQCALLVLHHRSTKFGAPDTRGSSAIEDQTDLLYVLESIRDDPERKYRKRLRCSKNRVDLEPPARWLRFERVAGFQTVEETEPYEADEDEPTVSEALIDEIRALAPEVRKDGAWAPHRLAEAVGRQRDDWAFKQALGALLESGEWIAEGKTRSRVVRPADDSGGDDFPFEAPS